MTSRLQNIFDNYLWFMAFYIIFVIVLIIFTAICRKKKSKSNIFINGFLLNLTNRQIFCITLLIFNFLLLVFTLVTKIDLTLGFAILSSSLVIIAFAVIVNVKYIFIATLINIVNLCIIFLANLVNVLYLTASTTAYFFLLVGTNVFGFLFYIFTLLLLLKNVSNKEEKHEKIN